MVGFSRDEKRRSASERKARERSMKKDLVWNQRNRMLVHGRIRRVLDLAYAQSLRIPSRAASVMSLLLQGRQGVFRDPPGRLPLGFFGTSILYASYT